MWIKFLRASAAHVRSPIKPCNYESVEALSVGFLMCRNYLAARTNKFRKLGIDVMGMDSRLSHTVSATGK